MHLEMDEMKELKSVLRSLVVSSPTQMDVSTLLRDFRSMMGCPLPCAKYGYRDPLAFLRERCADCFLFNGKSANPVLTLIVTENLKHIDSFVQNQKVSSSSKRRVKRRSVPESIFKTPTPNLIAKTFEVTQKPQRPQKAEEAQAQYKMTEVKAAKPKTLELEKPDAPKLEVNHASLNNQNHASVNNLTEDKDHSNELNNSSAAVNNFLRKRLPVLTSSQFLDSEGAFKDSDSGEHNSDSGRYTSSSGGGQQARLQQLRADVLALVGDCGVPCRDLIKLYRDRYGRELNFARFGYTSIASFACTLAEGGRVRMARGADGDWALVPGPEVEPALPADAGPPPRTPRRSGTPRAPREPAADPEDALPGIEFDPDVFPEDCLHFMESIPSMSLADLGPGAMLELILGEVYSPSHFWFIRLGEDYNIAMEEMMDEMTRYYGGAEGSQRALAAGAVRVGHYCASLYERDWHRALVVAHLDEHTVKVRHVDYGTVDTVAARELKPLRREWGSLPAQAVRGRLAGARPAAAGRCWPRAAATHFLRQVRDRRFVGNVVALDAEESIVELYLVDTSTETDVRVDLELIRAGHADPRPDSALAAADCYLYPRFEALESGATPNYAEIHAYLRDGIALEFVPEYRRHVPGCQPAYEPPRPAAPPLPGFLNRVPLFSACASAPALPRSSTPDTARPPSVEPSPAPSPARPLSQSTEVAVVPVRMRASPAVLEHEPGAVPDTESPPPERSHPPGTMSSPSESPRAESPPNESPGTESPPNEPSAGEASPIGLPPTPPAPPPPTHHPPHRGTDARPGRLAAPLGHLPPFLPPAFPAGPMAFFPTFPGFPVPCPPPGLYPYAAPPLPRPPPRAFRPPPPPPRAAPLTGEVTLSAPECEIFRLLTRVDPNAAHWYMVDAIERAARGPAGPAVAPRSSLDPEAREFRLGPPPGFGGH